MKKKMINLMLVFVLVLLAACSNGNAGETTTEAEDTNDTVAQEEPAAEEPAAVAEEPTAEDGPIKLKMLQSIWQVFLPQLQEKYPNVEFEIIPDEFAAKGYAWYEELIAANNVPDLIGFGDPYAIKNLTDYEMIMPLDALIEKNNYDMSRINPEIMAYFNSYTPDENNYVLPVDLATWTVYYNKDIFDLMGVPYPTDGMSWDDMIQLASKVTREVDGVQYRGMHPGHYDVMWQQFSANLLDPETDEPRFEGSKELTKFFEILDGILSIPGNLPAEAKTAADVRFKWDDFYINQRNIAMLPVWNSSKWYEDNFSKQGLNWDQVTWPVLGGSYASTGPYAQPQMIAIGSQTKHADLIFEMMQYLTSDEFQMQMMKDQIKLPIMKLNNEIREEFINIDYFETPKNMAAYVQYPYAVPPTKISKYEAKVFPLIDEGITMLLEGNNDINTILRTLQEKAAVIVQEAKAAE